MKHKISFSTTLLPQPYITAVLPENKYPGSQTLPRPMRSFLEEKWDQGEHFRSDCETYPLF